MKKTCDNCKHSKNDLCLETCVPMDCITHDFRDWEAKSNKYQCPECKGIDTTPTVVNMSHCRTCNLDIDKTKNEVINKAVSRPIAIDRTLIKFARNVKTLEYQIQLYIKGHQFIEDAGQLVSAVKILGVCDISQVEMFVKVFKRSNFDIVVED